MIQDKFSELKKRCWGQHLWSKGYFCAIVESVNEETIKRYIASQEKIDIKNNFKFEK